MSDKTEKSPPFSESLTSWLIYCAALAGAAAILNWSWSRGLIVAAAGVLAAVAFLFVMIVVAGRASRARGRR